MGQEGDDVVLGLALDLVDPRDVEGDVACLGPDRLGGFLGDDAEFGLRVRRMRLDLEPDLEAGLRLPDGGHFRTGIAGDHQALQANCFLRRALANRTGRGHPYGAARGENPGPWPDRKPPGLRLQAGQPALDGKADKLRIGSHARLGLYEVVIVLHGLDAEIEVGGDLLRGRAGSKLPEDLDLPFPQLV